MLVALEYKRAGKRKEIHPPVELASPRIPQQNKCRATEHLQDPKI